MPTIEIFSTPTCSFCKQLKAFLEERGVSYLSRDITLDTQALEEMLQLTGGGMGVPVTVFNKGTEQQKLTVGFSDAIRVLEEF